MTKLSINVNKVATIRNARGKNTPDVVLTALKLIQSGAQGITVHPRPDERHIRWDDVFALKNNIGAVELNIEGYPTNDFLVKVTDALPAQCTLVPDPPHVLTSNAGWRLQGNEKVLETALPLLREKNIRVSLFVDPATITTAELIAFRDMGVERIELYTEAFADAFGSDKQQEITAKYKACASLAQSMGLEINAGHDLNLHNLQYLVREIPFISEVSIGHALVADALDYGWQATVQAYLQRLR
ncbi:MAG: pyridoxine 5'-phosphate synthase [Bdellovibrionaceae bacterium]|nr:pyridoxine 5'-phosphate synthase [Pseudobdellovibrionaceae bacterium]